MLTNDILTSTGQHLIFLSLGSNISPRRHYIARSLELLKSHFPQQFRCSSLYHTRPFHDLEQPGYLNAVLQCSCDLDPLGVLTVISEIEEALGRRRSRVKWASRTIDIDILLWGSDIIRIPRLSIPHYDLSNRDFFLVPLLELDSRRVHPETGIPLQRLLDAIPDDLRTCPEKIGPSDHI